MSGLIYQAAFENVSMGADVANLVHMAVNLPTKLLFFSVSSNEIDIDVRRIRLGVVGPAQSGGSALTEVPVQRRNTVTASNVVAVDSVAGGTLVDVIFDVYWQVNTKFIYHPTPEIAPLYQGATPNNLIWRFPEGAAVDFLMSGTIVWEEF